MSKFLDDMESARVRRGATILKKQREWPRYKAALAVRAGVCGPNLEAEPLPSPRYASKIKDSWLSVYRTGISSTGSK